MVRIQEIPLLLLLCFTLVYSTIGNPDNVIWSGLYFLVIHSTLLFLFCSYKSVLIRKIGIALNLTILFYISSKFIFKIDIFRTVNFLIFTICLLGIFLIEKRNNRNEKGN